MKTIWSNKIDEILGVGYPLDNIGVHNWALTKKQALQVLEYFLISDISILGGDVYENIDGIIRSNYDSWHCDILPEETKSDFVKRSLKETKTYIEKYMVNRPNKVFFVFIPGL